MRKFIRVIRITTIVLVLSLFCCLPLMADNTEFEWEYFNSTDDVIVNILWSKTTPTIKFIDPNGTSYEPFAAIEKDSTMFQNKNMFYHIENPAKGQWKLVLDKHDNENVEIGIMNYFENPEISALSIGDIKNDHFLPVSFQVDHEENMECFYELSAATTEFGPGKILEKGTAQTNIGIQKELDLNKLASYENYLISLKVWITRNETDYFDSEHSHTFSWKSGKSNKKLNDIKVQVLLDQNFLKFNWPYLGNYTEKIMFAVFTDDELEPYTFMEYDPDEGEALLDYHEDAKKVTVEISLKQDDVYSSTLSKYIDMTNKPFYLEAKQVSKVPYLTLNYENIKGEELVVRVNDILNEIELKQSGNLDIGVNEFDNVVIVAYEDDQKIEWIEKREIYVDLIAPRLEFDQDINNLIVSDDSIVINGTLKDATLFRINEEEVSVDIDGRFSKEIFLKEHENKIKIIAEDAVGNKTQYECSIYNDLEKGIKKVDDEYIPQAKETAEANYSKIMKWDMISKFDEKSYFVLTIVSLICLAIALYVLIMWERRS